MLKNGWGATIREGASVLAEVTSDSHYKPTRTTFPNSSKYITEYGIAKALGVSFVSTEEVDNGNGELLDQNNELNIGAGGILGLQVNWDNSGIKDVRFGLDGGVGLAAYFGVKFNLQMGVMYVFK